MLSNNNNLLSEFMTVAEIRDYLNVSTTQAYALTHRKDFPVSRFGGAIRVPRKAFLAWVDTHTSMPANLTVA